MVQLFFTLNGKNEPAISADDVDLLPSHQPSNLYKSRRLVRAVSRSTAPLH